MILERSSTPTILPNSNLYSNQKKPRHKAQLFKEEQI